MSRCSASVFLVSLDWLLLPLREGIERNESCKWEMTRRELPSRPASRGTSLKTANLSTTAETRPLHRVITGTFQARPSLKQTAVEIPGAGILLRPSEIAVRSTPEDNEINKGSCVSDPPSP